MPGQRGRAGLAASLKANSGWLPSTWEGSISEVPEGIFCNDSPSSGLIKASRQKTGL